MEESYICFDATKSKYKHIFKVAALMTNFSNRKRMDFAHEVVGPREEDDHFRRWEGWLLELTIYGMC